MTQRRRALYSSATRSPAPGSVPAASETARVAEASEQADAIPRRAESSLKAWSRRHERLLILGAAIIVAIAVVLARDAIREPATEYTQDDIDAAVVHALDTKTLPSRAAKAAESVRESVVRVRGYTDAPAKGSQKAARAGLKAPGSETAKDAGKDAPPKVAPGHDGAREGEVIRGVGSGVVIVDDGTILTNLHVVQGSKRLSVTFYDGSESDADVIAAFPENDLAVIKAKTIPDDLPPATVGSTDRLRPGDEVVAVGFPFGIGPSVSAGVISGLNREFRTPEGDKILTRLIQFDAAANMGNSGGPLVTMDGEVVGIVTAILNPSRARTFIGIGFAATMEVAGAAAGIPPF